MADQFPSNFDLPDQSAGFLLWQAANAWQREQKSALDDLGLTHVQFVLLASLSWLTRAGETITQIELARHANADVMMTSQVLRVLENRKLIERSVNLKDSRAKCLRVTAEGQQLVATSLPLVENTDAKFFRPLANHLDSFRQSLQLLVPSSKGTGKR